MAATNHSKKTNRVLRILLAIGFLALAAGAANAAIQSIQLNSSASFPVDI